MNEEATPAAPEPAPQVLDWVCAAVGPDARIAGAPVLMSVSSTTLHAVDVVDGRGALRPLALRRFHDTARLAQDPWYRPQSEAAVLDLLAPTDVAAPALHAGDLGGAAVGLPALLIDRVPGRPDWREQDSDAVLAGLAGELVRIHEVDGADLAALPAYRPYYDPAIDGPRVPPSWTSDRGRWERVFALLDEPPPEAPTGFIHRDYHPGQALWLDGALSGIIDWTTGCRGPFAVDLARMRLNLAIEAGGRAAREFLVRHTQLAGADLHHPYWDLVDAADFILDAGPPRTGAGWAMWAAFEEWVAEALAELAPR